MSCPCCDAGEPEKKKDSKQKVPNPPDKSSEKKPKDSNKSSGKKSSDSKKKKKKEKPKANLDHIGPVNRSDYTWGRSLGDGAFGKVYLVTHKKTGQEMACKCIQTEFFTNFLLQQQCLEISTMQELSGLHPTMLQLFDVKKHKKTELLLFLELCAGGSLESGIKNQDCTSESDIRTIARQCFEGLNFLHSRSIAHMDLKPDNIAFVKEHDKNHEIRLLDFGVTATRERGGKKIRGMRGTPPYMAPELLASTGFTEQSDMWSMGVIIYQLLTGRLPFKMGRRLPTKKQVPKLLNRKRVKFPSSISKKAKDVIMALLQYEAAKRPTPSDILKYPWFTTDEDVKISPDVMEKFDMFAKRGILQKALTPLMLDHVRGVDKHLIEYAQNLHRNTDKDTNGEFDFDEFKMCLGEIKERQWSDGEMKEIFDAIDEDGSGEVSLKEFMAWFSYDYVIKQDERLWKFIRTLDENGDGKITLAEIESSVKRIHPEWDEYMKAFEAVMKPDEMYSIEYFAQLLLGDDNETEQTIAM